MKICYHCDVCGADIADLDMAEVDEAKLGFDCLTGEERQDIINFDPVSGTMHVKTFCDACVTKFGLDGLSQSELKVNSNPVH